MICCLIIPKAVGSNKKEISCTYKNDYYFSSFGNMKRHEYDIVMSKNELDMHSFDV